MYVYEGIVRYSRSSTLITCFKCLAVVRKTLKISHFDYYLVISHPASFDCQHMLLLMLVLSCTAVSLQISESGSITAYCCSSCVCVTWLSSSGTLVSGCHDDHSTCTPQAIRTCTYGSMHAVRVANQSFRIFLFPQIIF